MEIKDNKKRLKKISKIFSLVADLNRLRILCTIFCDRESCVSEIAQKLNLSVAITSHHLLTLTKLNILESKRDGKKICYFLSKNPINKDLKNIIKKY